LTKLVAACCIVYGVLIFMGTVGMRFKHGRTACAVLPPILAFIVAPILGVINLILDPRGTTLAMLLAVLGLDVLLVFLLRHYKRVMEARYRNDRYS
jgi:hypothetical protein